MLYQHPHYMRQLDYEVGVANAEARARAIAQGRRLMRHLFWWALIATAAAAFIITLYMVTR